MQPVISVIICTHNPRRDYLERVLQALNEQILPQEFWELLLIDNASEQVLSEEIDLSWHPRNRCIREEQLGLTSARLRGIKEAVAKILVFVDDDNVLDKDYLEVTLKISKNWPILGAWSGQIRPDFEEQPPDWTKPYWAMLAIREFEQNQWSNLRFSTKTTPWGAGLCVRKVVAQKYAELVYNQPERATLGRKGNQLLSCEDNDLALTSCDIGLGTGLFTSLKLTHLISAYRLQENHLLRLAQGMGYSHTILNFFQQGKLPDKQSWPEKLLQYYQSWQMDSRTRRLHLAFQKGIKLALKELIAR
ncbi:glycosyltransferase [Nostoc sp. NMS8]|uniref:glycosyltransferase n=1 Tax=Nostoc sp. NMS8 TaxID=2815392 RepID=UPI0025F2F071|nr:glycosyltransferase [Nostoc sp. NMS8]MBN3960047.1 glycosyltransferase family 2 protein [Nostoc sp. NMS8]